MVELFEDHVRQFDRHSSKGNQLKWECDGVWYKADYTGYEGLAEYVISQLLKKSTLDKNEFVVYELEQIKYKRQIFNGAKSNRREHGNRQHDQQHGTGQKIKRGTFYQPCFL